MAHYSAQSFYVPALASLLKIVAHYALTLQRALYFGQVDKPMTKEHKLVWK